VRFIQIPGAVGIVKYRTFRWAVYVARSDKTKRCTVYTSQLVTKILCSVRECVWMGGISRIEFAGPADGDLNLLTTNFLTLLQNLHCRYANDTTNNITHRVKSFSYLLTPWCRVLLEKLTGLQLVKKFPPHFTEPEGSSPHSQASATCLYPGPVQSSPHAHIPPPGDPS